jgi:hypothetical protein
MYFSISGFMLLMKLREKKEAAISKAKLRDDDMIEDY